MISSGNFIGAVLRELLFPAGCAVCGDGLFSGQEAWYGLCAACMAGLEPEEGRRCLYCGRPLVSEQLSCLSCRAGDPPQIDKALSLFPYSGRYVRLLRSFKFGKNRGAGNFLLEQMQRAVLFFAGLENPPLAWVPVPPRPGKIRKTGWDQIDDLGKRLRRNFRNHTRISPGGRHDPLLVLPVCFCLRRLPSKSQKFLDKADRRTNLRGKIQCVRSPPSSLLLFDDVVTSGATLEVCAEVLKKAGAEKVYALSLFYD